MVRNMSTILHHFSEIARTGRSLEASFFVLAFVSNALLEMRSQCVLIERGKRTPSAIVWSRETGFMADVGQKHRFRCDLIRSMKDL